VPAKRIIFFGCHAMQVVKMQSDIHLKCYFSLVLSLDLLNIIHRHKLFHDVVMGITISGFLKF
jgi:hypothetical protein